LLNWIVMQIGPAQTLHFVFAPETCQIDFVHRRATVSDASAAV
jgi:hypothetical protein